MSTLFRISTLVAVIAAGCGRTVATPQHPSPAPADPQDSAAHASRQWKNVTIEGPYGPFEMAVPALRIGSNTSLLIDSVALREVERRLLARIARVARAQAASLIADTGATMMSTRNPAPEIRPGLLGAIAFGDGEIDPSLEGETRLKAVAALAAQLPGTLRLVAQANGTGAGVVDVALARARRVYLTLLAQNPHLAGREVSITVQSIAMLPGAPLPRPVVEVYVSAK